MNPDTNKFELSILPESEVVRIKKQIQEHLLAACMSGASAKPLHPDDTLVPTSWVQFQIGEIVDIKNYTFRVAYINDSTILFEPVGPVLASQEKK
jgi:hypothetical protein